MADPSVFAALISTKEDSEEETDDDMSFGLFD